MRVYVPATVTMLRQLVAGGELPARSGLAFALTPALRESYASGDTEELEYVAMVHAARASLRLLSAELDAGSPAGTGQSAATAPRRVVVAADVDGVTARPDLDDGVVSLPGPVGMAAVASVHVDVAEAEEAVRNAAAVIDAADLGDPDAEFTLGEAESHELAWYAPQEVGFLLDLL